MPTTSLFAATMEDQADTHLSKPFTSQQYYDEPKLQVLEDERNDHHYMMNEELSVGLTESVQDDDDSPEEEQLNKLVQLVGMEIPPLMQQNHHDKDSDKYRELLKQLFEEDEDEDDYLVISSMQQRYDGFFLEANDALTTERVSATIDRKLVSGSGIESANLEEEDDNNIITITSSAKPILPIMSTVTVQTSNHKGENNLAVAISESTDMNIDASSLCAGSIKEDEEDVQKILSTTPPSKDLMNSYEGIHHLEGRNVATSILGDENIKEDDDDDDNGIITVVSSAKPIVPKIAMPSATNVKTDDTNSNHKWNHLAGLTTAITSSWLPPPTTQQPSPWTITIVTFLVVQIAACGVVVYIIYSFCKWNGCRKKDATVSSLLSSSSSSSSFHPIQKRETPPRKRKIPSSSSPTSAATVQITTQASRRNDLDHNIGGTGKEINSSNNNNDENDSGTVEVASAALALLSLSFEEREAKRTPATNTKPTNDDDPSKPPVPNPKSRSQMEPQSDHHQQQGVSSLISSLEVVQMHNDEAHPTGVATTTTSTVTLIPNFKKFKISTDDDDDGKDHIEEAETPTTTPTMIQKLATTIQDTQQALVQCGQDPSLAPMVALFRHERHELMESQKALERSRRQWEQHQRNFDRQLSHQQQQETIETLKTTSKNNSFFLWSCNEENRLEQIRDKCWNAVSRLLMEVVLVYRLARQLGYPLLRAWKKIQQQQKEQNMLYGDHSLSHVGLWLSTVGELACGQCSSRASVLSEAPPSSFLYSFLYLLPSSSSSEVLYLRRWWITFMDSGFCYAMCIVRWGSVLGALLLAHSLLRIFSAPMSIHNGVNLMGAYWLYMSSSSSPLVTLPTEVTSSTMVDTNWQWLILVASVASLLGVVQWQYWQCKSHLNRKLTTGTATNDKDHYVLRQAMGQMNEFYERLQLLRLVLIITYALSWWWYYHDVSHTEDQLYPEQQSLSAR